MIKDVFSVSACVIGALATLKGQMPTKITVDNSAPISVTYIEIDGTVYCKCNGFKAYAKLCDKDFTVFVNGNPYDFFAGNPELLKRIFTSAAAVMSGISGAELYITEEE